MQTTDWGRTNRAPARHRNQRPGSASRLSHCLSSRIFSGSAITFNPDSYRDVVGPASCSLIPNPQSLFPVSRFALGTRHWALGTFVVSLPRFAASSSRGAAVCPSSDGSNAARRFSLSPRGGFVRESLAEIAADALRPEDATRRNAHPAAPRSSITNGGQPPSAVTSMLETIDQFTVHGRTRCDMDRRVHGGDSAGPPARPSAFCSATVIAYCAGCGGAIWSNDDCAHGYHDECLEVVARRGVDFAVA